LSPLRGDNLHTPEGGIRQRPSPLGDALPFRGGTKVVSPFPSTLLLSFRGTKVVSLGETTLKGKNKSNEEQEQKTTLKGKKKKRKQTDCFCSPLPLKGRGRRCIRDNRCSCSLFIKDELGIRGTRDGIRAAVVSSLKGSEAGERGNKSRSTRAAKMNKNRSRQPSYPFP
jgi:hypothetical protein